VIAGNLDRVLAQLAHDRAPLSSARLPQKPGVYALFIDEVNSLSSTSIPADGLLYIGSSSDLSERHTKTHFLSGQSGFSTLRRTLGAILKDDLELNGIARGKGSGSHDFTNYRFDPNGEQALTSWMKAHLEIATYVTGSDFKNIERSPIVLARPPLNLDKLNPQRARIMALRKRCADEARACLR
jgi:hypothetical protein